MRASKQTLKRRRVIKKCRVLWQLQIIEKYGNRCELCGKPMSTVHHFHRKSRFAHIRFDIDNGIIVCRGCHFDKVETPIGIEQIRKKRGEEWYQRIMKKAKNPPKNFKASITWWKQQYEKIKSVKSS